MPKGATYADGTVVPGSTVPRPKPPPSADMEPGIGKAPKSTVGDYTKPVGSTHNGVFFPGLKTQDSTPFGAFDSLQESYVGGPNHAYDNMLRAGLGAGANMVDYGTGISGAAANYAGGLVNEGRGIGAEGIRRQDQSLEALINQAKIQGPSQAQALMQAAQDQQARQMMGMASATRGGNQAAAMRNAQVIGAQNALQTQQQLGALRAQEEAQRQANILAAQQYASGAYGDRAGLGYGVATDSTSTMGDIGAGVTNAGVSREGNYAGIISDTEIKNAELERERQRDIREAGKWQRDFLFDSIGGIGKVFSFLG